MQVDPSTKAHVNLASVKATSGGGLANASLFSAQLAQASTKAQAGTATLQASDSSSSSSSDTSASTKTPKGEKTEAVKGHAYSEIIAGPRNGMFLNTSGNPRDGDAFARVRRDGREFHIYGTGKHRLIVEVKHRDKSSGTSNDTTGDNGSATTGSSTTAPATDTTGAPAT